MKNILKYLKKNIYKFNKYLTYKNKKRNSINYFLDIKKNNSTLKNFFKKINTITLKNKIQHVLSTIIKFIKKTQSSLSYKKNFIQNILFFEENFNTTFLKQHCYIENKKQKTFSKFQIFFYSTSNKKELIVKKYYKNFFAINFYKTTIEQYDDLKYLGKHHVIIQNILNFYTPLIKKLPIPSGVTFREESEKKGKDYRGKYYVQLDKIKNFFDFVKKKVTRKNLSMKEKTTYYPLIKRLIEDYTFLLKLTPFALYEKEKMQQLILQVKIWKKAMEKHVIKIFDKFGIFYSVSGKNKNFRPLINIQTWKKYCIRKKQYSPFMRITPYEFLNKQEDEKKPYRKFLFPYHFLEKNNKIVSRFTFILNYFTKTFKINTRVKKAFKKIVQYSLSAEIESVLFFKKKIFSNMYDIRDKQTQCFNIFENSIRNFLKNIYLFSSFALADFFLQKGIVFYNLDFLNPIINPYSIIPDNTLITFNPKFMRYPICFDFKNFIKKYNINKKLWIFKNFLYKNYIFYKTLTPLKFFFEPFNTLKEMSLSHKQRNKNILTLKWEFLKKKSIAKKKLKKKIRKNKISPILEKIAFLKLFNKSIFEDKNAAIKILQENSKKNVLKTKAFLLYYPFLKKYSGYSRNNSVKLFKKLKFFKNLYRFRNKVKNIIKMPVLYKESVGYMLSPHKKEKIFKLWRLPLFKKTLFKKVLNIEKKNFLSAKKFKIRTKSLKFLMYFTIKKYYPIKNIFFYKKKIFKSFLKEMKNFQKFFSYKKIYKNFQKHFFVDFWEEEQSSFLQMGYSNFF